MRTSKINKVGGHVVHLLACWLWWCPLYQWWVKKKKRALKYLYKYFKCSLWPCLMYMWSSLHFSFKNFHFIFHFCFKTNWDFRDIHPKKIKKNVFDTILSLNIIRIILNKQLKYCGFYPNIRLYNIWHLTLWLQILFSFR